MQPTPTATDKAIKRDGKLLLRLMGLIADMRMLDSLEVDPDRPTIAAGNHQSLLDVFMAAAFCHAADVSCRFLVNAKYFDQRGIGPWLRRIGCIPLNGETKEQAFIEALASLERLELVGIMPEGRLTKPEERDPQVGPFRPGVAELARLSGAVVRPITFHQSGLAWPRAKWPKLRLPKNRPIVTMRLGGPVTLDGADDIANAKLIEDANSALLDALDAEQGIERKQ